MTAEQIQQQQARGFLTLRFVPALEADYRKARSALIRQRARLASIAGLLLFLVYALVDLMTLPAELARLTAGIRLAITCPIIAPMALSLPPLMSATSFWFRGSAKKWAAHDAGWICSFLPFSLLSWRNSQSFYLWRAPWSNARTS